MEALTMCIKQLNENSHTTRDFANALTERSDAVHQSSLMALSALPEQIFQRMVVVLQTQSSLHDSLIGGFQNFGRAIQTMPVTFAETWSSQLPSLIRSFSEAAATLVQRNLEDSRRLVVPPTTLVQRISTRQTLKITSRTTPPVTGKDERSALTVRPHDMPRVVEVTASDEKSDNDRSGQAAVTINLQRRPVAEMEEGSRYRVAFDDAGTRIVQGVYGNGKITGDDGKLHDVANALWTELIEAKDVAKKRRRSTDGHF
jgi:hypothetical protein